MTAHQRVVPLVLLPLLMLLLFLLLFTSRTTTPIHNIPSPSPTTTTTTTTTTPSSPARLYLGVVHERMLGAGGVNLSGDEKVLPPLTHGHLQLAPTNNNKNKSSGRSTILSLQEAAVTRGCNFDGGGHELACGAGS